MSSVSQKPVKKIVIVGGGFGGLNAARALAKKKRVSAILIDQRNHHLFQPLLYQVATAGLNAADIAVPIRSQFSHDANIEVHWGEVTKVELGPRRILLKDGTSLDFDFLILSCGAQHSYFAHPEWEEFAPGLKTLEQATEIRRRLLSAFENAENEMDPEKQKNWLNFVVVGGGPTGVELAGAIADISRTVLVHDFKRIDPSTAKVVLVEAGPRLLASFDEGLSRRTLTDLQALGVEVNLSSRVENIDGSGVKIGDRFIPSKCVFWGAGVQATKLLIDPPPATDRAGRVCVNADLSLEGFANVFVIGDMAAVPMGNGRFVPGLAPAAIQEGKHAAKMILATIEGGSRQNFQYLDKGQMATIGKHRAVMQFGFIKIGGYPAWLGWLFVHIFYLVGFKNRLSVMLLWAWSYIFSKRGSRLITEKDWKLRR